MRFIDEHQERFGVEPICRVLTEHGCKIAPSTFYDARHRQPSKRKQRDDDIIALITEQRKIKFVQLLGARKMWLRLRSQGHDVARCTVERLMHQMGISGVTRAKGPRTTIADPKADRPQDLVDRQFVANRPNELWCADFTYVPTWEGMVYVAFIFDVFSRMIIGWRAAAQMTTPLVLDALEMAVWARRILAHVGRRALCHVHQSITQASLHLESAVPGIGIHGSITLARTLLAAGLVDELRLVVAPTIAGSGQRLFEHPAQQTRLELVGSEQEPEWDTVLALPQR